MPLSCTTHVQFKKLFLASCAFAVLFSLSTTTPDVSISVTRPTSHATHAIIAVVSIYPCMSINWIAFHPRIGFLPQVSLHFLVPQGRGFRSLLCHLQQNNMVCHNNIQIQLTGFSAFLVVLIAKRQFFC